MAEKTAAPKPERVRKWVRLHPDTVQRIQYWGSKQDLNEQEFMEQAIEEKIARANGDYDLPVLEIQRVNQLVDEVKALSTNVANLETVTTTGFDSLLGLTRGDSYLLDDESGELSIHDTASAVAGG